MICNSLTRIQSNKLYVDVIRDKDEKSIRQLCLEDLFFLLTIACRRVDVNRDWLYERCREVEKNPNGHLDIWAREHYKSTIITFGKTIQDILINPNITVGIFSHTRPIAKAFLEQIKRELEENDMLQACFPDVLYASPQKESPKWSLDSGIIVKRNQNPKECTIEAWGLVDGQPTSKHYSLLIYDDVVTLASVTTPEQINKTTEALAISYNLAAEGGNKRFLGTRYNYNDTYRQILDRETAIPRIHTATDDGTLNGEPVLMSRETLMKKYKDMGVFVFSSQMLQNPTADKAMSFQKDWLMYYNDLKYNNHWNYYILVDPAGEKKKTNDYTVMVVIALGDDNNYYLVDGLRDRLNLTEKWIKLSNLVRKWKPINIGYEKYGLQSDIEHYKFMMNLESFRFNIIPLGGQISKNDRILGLVPIFENHRFFLPHVLGYVDYEGNMQDFIQHFINDEYLSFPVSTFDDMLDSIARVRDVNLKAKFPKIIHENHLMNSKNKSMRDYNVLSKSRTNRNSR